MNYYNKLDKVLIALSKVENHIFEDTSKIKQKLDFQISHYELDLILKYLVKTEYAFCETNEKLDNFELKKHTYKISLQGLLFLEKSSFNNEIKILKRKNNWTVAKTIAAILNAIIIVVIGALGVYVTNKSNVDKEENKVLHQTIDSLKSGKKIITNNKNDTLINSKNR